MQNHRLLAAALALDTFSAGELASTSGVPLNTARSEISRKPELFADAEAIAQSGARGRPPRRYRLRDPDAARTELATARHDASPPVLADEPLSASDDQLLTLELAEHSLRRALLSDDPQDREDLARTATVTAERALDSLEADPHPEREQRARAVRDFAQFLRPESQPSKPRELRFAAAGALAAFSCVPGLGAAPLLTALVGLARVAKALPPIAVVTRADARPSDALHGLQSSGWHSRPFFAGECLWSPAWADVLTEHNFLAGVVIVDGEHDEQEMTHLIHEVHSWRLPMVVAHPPDSSELRERYFEQGVTVMPTPDAEAALSWFGTRLTDHTAASPATRELAAVAPALARA
jgi:hypothetical protein